MKRFGVKKGLLSLFVIASLIGALVSTVISQTESNREWATQKNEIGADLEAGPIAGKAPLEVNFQNLCEGIPNYFIWDYGDGLVEHLRQGWPIWTDPYHFYLKPGEYDVSLSAWGKTGYDIITIPNFIYVDANYSFLPLQLENSGKTFPGEDWLNAIDHDVWGVGSVVSALPEDAWAVYSFENRKEMNIYKIRFLTDTAMEHKYITNLVKNLEIWTSIDSVDFELAYQGSSDKLNGEWDLIELPEPVRAKYVLLVLTSSRGENAQYREIAEFQLFGTGVESLAKPLADAAPENSLPQSFQLGQNYPNPFNPHTVIPLEIPELAEVTLSIYDIQGRLVRQLLNHVHLSGRIEQIWDGTDAQNQPVAAGMYMYCLTAASANQRVSLSNKMILMK